MKSLRKSFLTLLALTLFGGAGAWAQEEVLLTTVTATSLTTYDETTPGIVTVALNDIGDYSINIGWSLGGSVTVEAPQGYTITRCVFKQGSNYSIEDNLAPFTATIVYDPGSPALPYVSVETSPGQAVINYDMTGIKFIEVYGYAAPQAIELTKAGANQWTLGQTPDYDLELQVEYYEAHALKNIPAGWQVMVNGVDKTAAIDHDSLLITETDTVTLVPAGNPRRVKSVTLEEVPSAVLVESITLNKTATTILAGSTETLSVSSVTPDDATDQSVTWSSDNTDVATVGATTGEVTAVGVGTANITATANDGSGVTATCAVTVSPRIVTWNPSDIVPENPGDHSFTKDGITITAATCDFQQLTFSGGGTFTTTLGNFTKIEISADYTGNVSGTGWSNDGWQSATWTGNAASVSFSGDIWGGGMTCEGGNLTIVFTFEQ